MNIAEFEPAVGKHNVDRSSNLEIVPAREAPDTPEKGFSDPHPLLPVLIVGAFALILAMTFVGAIIAWLALRHF